MKKRSQVSAIDFLERRCDEVAGMLKAIAHPKRLRILCALQEGEKSVSELEIYCQASQSSVSQYLAKMKSEGLLFSRREAQQVFYAIGSPELRTLVQSLAKIYSAR